MIADQRYDQIMLGQTAEFSVAISRQLVDQFADVSGDKSPLHVSDEYARSTSFGERVVHGALISSFFRD